jgi:hypothetical protein
MRDEFGPATCPPRHLQVEPVDGRTGCDGRCDLQREDLQTPASDDYRRALRATRPSETSSRRPQ